MPRIKRWFPVSHDINSDHEMWEMTGAIGDRSLRVWLEFLSMADRNEGQLPPWSDSLATTVGFKCHTTPTKVRLVWDFATTKEWLKCDPVPRTRNHWKYHKMREPEKIPSGNPKGSLPSEPSEPSEPKRSKPSADSVDKSKNGRGHWESWRLVADSIYASDPIRFARLVVWLSAAKKGRYPEEVITAALEKFAAADQKQKIENWWPYLEKLAQKAFAEYQQAESRRMKGEEAKFIGAVVGRVGRVME